MSKQGTPKVVPFTFTAAEIEAAKAGHFDVIEKRVNAELQRRARTTKAPVVSTRSTRTPKR